MSCLPTPGQSLILILASSGLELPSARHPADQVHQANQDRDLDQRPDSRGEGLRAIGPESRDGHRDCQLEVVTGSRKALRRRELVAEPEITRDPEREEENDDEVDDEGRGDTDDRHDLLHDLAALRCEQDQDRVEKADERPRPEVAHEDLVVPPRAGQPADEEPGQHSRSEGDSQEHSNAGGYYRVGYTLGSRLFAHDADEEDGHWGVQDHLQERVDGNENGAVFRVTAGKCIPDQNLDPDTISLGTI